MFFFFMLGFISLMFKYDHVLFVLISFEYLVLGIIMYLLSLMCNFFILFYMMMSVISSIFIMIIMVSLVKNFGSDLCYF